MRQRLAASVAVIGIAFCSILLCAQAPVVCPGNARLSESDLIRLIAGQVSEQRLRQWIETCGVGVAVTSEVEERLRAAGATDAMLVATRTPDRDKPETPSPSPIAKPVPAQLPDVVASVNGEDVKKSELEMAVRTLEDRAGKSVPPEQRDTVYRQVLDRVIGFHLLLQEAKSRKMVAPPWEVDGQLEQLKKQFPSEEQFQAMLKTRGVTFDQLRAETADSAAVNKMLEGEIEPKLTVSEPEVKKFYDENKARFRQEDSVHASHILIRVDETADAATKRKAKAQAEDLLKQLKMGAPFSNLAKAYSQDPGSAPNGGDLGFFSKGQMVPAFELAAFSLKAGQISAVVESPFGFHIIKVIETKPGKDLTYEEARAQVDDYLKQQLRDRKTQEFVDALRRKGRLKIFI